MTDAQKKVACQSTIRTNKRKYKTNSKARKLQIRYSSATVQEGRKTRTCTLCKKVKSIYAFDINHSLNNKTTKRTYCFVCRKRMNREYHARKKAEKAMING